MANQKQEVELLIKAGTEGLKSIGQLVKELEALGEDTGEASEQLEGLAGALSDLRDQQKLVRQFADLKSQTKGLAEEQAQAKERATELGRALAQTEKPTRAQRNEFEKAKKAAREAEQAWQDNQQQLNGLRSSMNAAGISTRDLASEQQRIKREIAGVDEEINSVSGELTQLRDSAREASRGTRELGAGANESTGRLGAFRKRLDELNPVLGKIGSGLKVVGAAIAGLTAAAGASLATVTVFSRRQGEMAEELTNTARALGVSREQLQLWRIAGDRVGLSGEQVSSMLRDVSERLGEFSRTGGGEAADVLESLNLKIRDLRDLSPDQQMRQLAQAIGEIGSQSEQIALLEMLASDASQLQPLLEENAAGLRAIFDEAQQEGAIYSEAELAKLNRANDIYNRIDLKLKALVSRISVELAPTVAEATEKVLELFGTSGDGEDLIDVFKRLVRQSGDFVKNLTENGADIADRFRTVTTVLITLGNVGRTVFNGMMTAVSTFGTIASTSFSVVMSLVQGIAKALEVIGSVSEESYSKIEGLAERARQKTEELAKQTAKYAKQTLESGGDVVGVFTDIENAADGASKATEENVYTLKDLPDEIETAADSAEEALRRQREEAARARDELADMGVDAELALTGISTEAREAINGIGDLADGIKRAGLEGESAAKAFEDGFEEAISKINSREGLLALREEIENLEESGEIGGEGAAKGLELIRQKLLQIMNLNGDLNEDLQEGVEGIQESGDQAGESVERLSDTLNNSSKEAQEFKEKWRDAWGGAFGKVLTDARESVTALSKAARNLFETRINSNQFVQGAVDLEDALAKANQEVYELSQASQRLMNNSFGDWFNNIALQAARTRQEFYQQALQLDQLVDKVSAGAYSMDELARLSETAANRFDLLDTQQLSGLRTAIDSARSKLESLNDSAESTLNSLRQRLADIRGDTEEAQLLQYESERRRLIEQLEASREAGATEAVREYEEALRVLQEINRTEQQNRREEQNERERAAADRYREQQRAEQERQLFQREVNPSRAPEATPPTAPAQRIELTLPTGGVANLSGDPESVNDFLEFLNQAGMRTSQ